MSEAVIELYNTLNEEAQKEVYDFMLFLVHKKQSGSESDSKSERKEQRKKALFEFAGSMKSTFKNIDGLGYQNRLRKEWNFVYNYFISSAINV